MPDGELNFYSISEDGTVCNWLLMQSEMSKTVIVTLVLDIEPQITLGGVNETLIGKLFIVNYNVICLRVLLCIYVEILQV